VAFFRTVVIEESKCATAKFHAWNRNVTLFGLGERSTAVTQAELGCTRAVKIGFPYHVGLCASVHNGFGIHAFCRNIRAVNWDSPDVAFLRRASGALGQGDPLEPAFFAVFGFDNTCTNRTTRHPYAGARSLTGSASRANLRVLKPKQYHAALALEPANAEVF